MNRDQQTIRAAITNEVIRAVAALRQQRTVAREQDGQTVFVPGTEAAREYLIETLDRVLGDSTPPATPVEPPDENWFQRQARLAARDVQLLPPWLRSHPPAVSGEGERLKDAAEAFRAIALDALACWQGEDETQDDKHKRTRSAQARTLLRHRLHSANGMLRASTPTPGAPR